MNCPAEVQYQQFWQEMEQYEKEKKVPYITSVERHGIEKGKREGFLKALTLGIKYNFGPDGLKLLPAIQAINDVEKLEALCDALDKVSSLDEFSHLCA
jgi:hypothetical protein